MRDIPIIPSEYKSGKFKILKKSETTTFKTDELKQELWTVEEENWIWDLYEKGYSYGEICQSVSRNVNSISIKMKRLKKKKDLYNEKHRESKYLLNNEYLDYMGNKIETVLDVFCGHKMFYKERYNTLSNDINTNIDCDSHYDVDFCLDKCIENNCHFDLVDLDSFGATIQYLEKALIIANRGLIMTLGEVGHRRWKRLDFISKYYDIDKVEDITMERMIENIIRIAKERGVFLKVIRYADWGNIGRVWFEILGD